METFYASHEIGLSEDAEAERRSAVRGRGGHGVMARVSEQVGRQIRAAREAQGMSQTELGRRLLPPVSHVAVSDMERGRVDIGLDRLADVSRALGIDMKPLLGWPQNYCPCCGQVVGGTASPAGDAATQRDAGR